MKKGIFAEFAPLYRKLGLEPRPIKSGSKACYVKGWTKPDSELSQAVLDSWIEKHPDYGIGLRMGTALPGGGHLGALDIDHDGYVRIGQVLLRGPVCGRVGKKGIAIFVRIMGDPPNSTFKVQREDQPDLQVADCLFDKKLCVIPPTIHPDTNQLYRWVGTPLHELDFSNLPAIGE